MLSDMIFQKFKKKIESIKKRIYALGDLRPGTLYTRYSVCGKPGCKCTRSKNPVKHGPYYNLSYTFQGKSHTEFIRHEEVKRIEEEIRNYEKLMKLVKELIDCSIQLSRYRKEK